MPSRRFPRKALLLVLVVAGALAAWQLWPASMPETGTRLVKNPNAVMTAKVELGDLEDTVLASGILNAADQVDVGAQVSGQVRELYVGLGDKVTKGQQIAEIDPRLQANELENAQAALNSLHAQKTARLASLTRAELVYKRAETLLKADAGSRDAFEEATASLVGMKADLLALNAQIRQAETALETAKVNLGYTKIESPINGVVVAIVSKQGQTVNSNQTTPTIATIAQLDTMVVKAKISEADIAKVKVGQEAYFSILGNPQKRYPAVLEVVEPIPDKQQDSSQGGAIYYNALFRVENPAEELRIAMTVEVSIILGAVTQVPIIPIAALQAQEEDGSYVVEVVRGKQIEKRKVAVGLNNNVQVQVVSGLTAGELVVTGNMPLEDAR